MTDIEVKQLIERLRQRINSNYLLLSNPPKTAPDADCHMAADLLQEALAFKQEVSDAVEDYHEACWPEIYFGFDHFIIPKPKPDPLVAAYHDALPETAAIHGKKTVIHLCGLINAALEARGLEIRSKNDD
jgi:hypothetical protein